MTDDTLAVDRGEFPDALGFACPGILFGREGKHRLRITSRLLIILSISRDPESAISFFFFWAGWSET